MLHVHWFRRDLRLADNPALNAALTSGAVLLPVYIHDPEAGGGWPLGAAARWWLHHSLSALDADLRRRGSRLIVRRGAASMVLRELLRESGARRVSWSRGYEPAELARDRTIEQSLRTDGIEVLAYNATLLYEPWALGRIYRVFAPYFRALRAQGCAFPLSPAPACLPPVAETIASLPLVELDLLPKIPWDEGLRAHWQPGEEGAHARLSRFLEHSLAAYHVRRDRPDLDGVSKLSPHLHFGEIGPRQIVHALFAEGSFGLGHEAYLRELIWREFAHHVLYYFPQSAEEPLDSRFLRFPWNPPDPATLMAWQRGITGIPLVDAGMRELWRTGWMHNRVRMVVASFLTKNLRIHWREGARWFWDTLVDADLANNSLGWQWSAGSGADAAPYFRIFNPVLQGERFDPEGAYVRRWVPELARLPASYIHKPWMAPAQVLQEAGVVLGQSYPRPLVDLQRSREEALAAFATLKRHLSTYSRDAATRQQDVTRGD